MMTLMKRRPTDAELAILRVLWKRGASTVREVADAMHAIWNGSLLSGARRIA